jgi:hypothetical protein
MAWQHREFDSPTVHQVLAPEALLAMQLICNQKIGGSIPSGGTKINTSMKDFLKSLPQLLSALPAIVQYIKYIPIIMILAGLGFGAVYLVQNRKDPYKCVNNHVFEQLRIDSDVYVFKQEGTCIDAKDLK